MRVSTSAFSQTLMSQLQRLGQRQAKLQNQVSTGQIITNLSDDPAAVGRVLNFETQTQQIQQYSRNNGTATALSKSTFAAVTGLKKLSDRAGELAVLGSSDTTSADSNKAYAAEVSQMLEQAVQTGNTKYNGSYIFAGTETATQPFVVDPPGATGDAITSVSYKGGLNSASVQVAEGSSVTASTDGATNGQFADFINHLVELRDALKSQSSSGVSTVQTKLQTSEDNFLTTISGIGAVQTRLESTAAQNESRFSSLQSLISQDTDADIAQTMVKLTQSQTAYQAAMQSGAKIMQTSLLDYLR